MFTSGKRKKSNYLWGVLSLFSLLILVNCGGGGRLNDEDKSDTPVVTSVILPTIIPTAVGEEGTDKKTEEGIYYVSKTGNDDWGDGSEEAPWGTISYGLTQLVDGDRLQVFPGEYEEQLILTGQYERGVTIGAAVPYQTRLRSNKTVLICFVCQGFVIEGFDIAHKRGEAERYLIQIQDLTDDFSGGQRLILRNNIIHDSYNNDLIKVNNGANHITIENNIFYNMGGPELDSHLDINSATDIQIQNNIFFNDYAGSGRINQNNTGSFIVIKDSNGEKDHILGSQNIVVRQNIFLNWEGDRENGFLVVGEDNVPYVQAKEVLIENNLMLGNSSNLMRAPIHLRGVTDILVQFNTINGDLPTASYGMRLSRAEKNERNDRILVQYNIWSDPTGSMGVERNERHPTLFEIGEESTEQILFQKNLYWNDISAVSQKEGAEFILDSYLFDPWLPNPNDLIVPRWVAEENRFSDGSATIHALFYSLVLQYGCPLSVSKMTVLIELQDEFQTDILGEIRKADQFNLGSCLPQE